MDRRDKEDYEPTEDTYVPTAKDWEQTESTQIKAAKPQAGRFGPEVFRPVLICLAGPLRGQRRSLANGSLVIGRSGSVDWRLNDSAASRRHAMIEYENADCPTEMPRCYVSDLGSRNGTELNGEVITGRTELRERDRVLVGSTVIGFFVRDEAELKHDESLYESATRDVLTGLDNRRQLLNYMRHHLARAERQRTRFAFLLADLDHFKGINDQYGHDVGDEALRHVAGLLRRSCRESDVVARWGGEEFALCLPDTPGDAALMLAERIRESIAMSELMIGSRTIRLTVSLGGTVYIAGDDGDSVFQRADRALYRAKNAGRNRVEFTEEADAPGPQGTPGI